MHMHPPKAHTLKHTILWLGQTHQSLSEQQIQIHIHTYTNIYTQTLSQAKLDMAGVLSMFRDVIHLLRVIVEPDKSWLDTKRLQPSFFGQISSSYVLSNIVTYVLLYMEKIMCLNFTVLMCLILSLVFSPVCPCVFDVFQHIYAC